MKGDQNKQLYIYIPYIYILYLYTHVYLNVSQQNNIFFFTSVPHLKNCLMFSKYSCTLLLHRRSPDGFHFSNGSIHEVLHKR